MTPTIDSPVPTSLVVLLIIAVTALAGVIGYLFQFYSKRMAQAAADQRVEADKQHQERVSWALERARMEATMQAASNALRAEYEAKHRILAEQHAKALGDLFDASREHEDQARREYLENIESVSQKAAEANTKVAAVLDKFYERYVGGPRRGQSF